MCGEEFCRLLAEYLNLRNCILLKSVGLDFRLNVAMSFTVRCLGVFWFQ